MKGKKYNTPELDLDIEDRVELPELQVLLNHMSKKLTISYPLYDFNFLTAKREDVGYKLVVDCSEADFDKQLSRFKGHSRELPYYSDFRGGLISSGVLEFRNMEDFREKLASYRKLSKEVKFSMDTNLLYFRFCTNYGLIKPSDMVLVETVGNEIKARLNHKYTPDKLAELKKMVKYDKNLFDELWNRRIKHSRKAAYIALWEYKNILDGVADELDEVRQSKADSSTNDMIIVQTLRNLENAGHTFPVLLTADDAMADLCNAEGLEYFKFDVPHAIEAERCNTKQLLNLIFNLATVFGFIKINSVIVFGEFRGKSSNKPYELNLTFLNRGLQKSFDRDLRICRRLMELGIQK